MSRLARNPDESEPISKAKETQEPQDDEEVTPLPASGDPIQRLGRAKDPLSAQPPAAGGRTPKWQEIIWREWCTCEDEEYAQHLFNLVSNTALGWGSALTVALSGTLYGLLAGYLLGLIALNWNVNSGARLLTGTLPVTLAWLVGVIGGVAGIWVSQQLSWQTWLAWLKPVTFFEKFGKSDLPDKEGWLGLGLGLVGVGMGWAALGGFLVAIVSGRKYEVAKANEYLMGGVAGAVVSALGALVGGLLGQGGELGAGLGLVLGIWAGAVWGNGLIGVLIGWLSILAGWLFFGVGDWITSWLSLSLGYGAGATLNTLRHRLNSINHYAHRPWYFWWRKEPSVTKVEGALQLMEQAQPQVGEVWAEPLRRLEQQKEQSEQPSLLIETLQSPNWADRFVARHGLVALGGKAIEPLRSIAAAGSSPLQSTALWLLTQIEQETANRLGWRSAELLCPHCLARFGAHSVNPLWGVSFTYYGCRLCGQSREYLEWLKVVAVLDANWGETYRQQDDQLRLNWLQRRTLFDFDQVEIVQATDEEVEHFAVQVGNDTDPFRQPRYSRIPYTLAPTCHLSENTLRILRRTFGRVEQLGEAAYG